MNTKHKSIIIKACATFILASSAIYATACFIEWSINPYGLQETTGRILFLLINIVVPAGAAAYNFIE